MAKAKVKKADVIRQGLEEHKDLGNTELAAKLNEKKIPGMKEITAQEVAVYRSKTSGGTKKRGKKKGQASNGQFGPQDMAELSELAKRAGGAENLLPWLKALQKI